MGLIDIFYDIRWHLTLAAAVAYGWVKIQAYYRLRAFKGPFSTGWLELWHIRALLSLDSHLRYKEACDKYGPIVRVGPNDLMTSSLDLLTHMSSVRSEYTRTPWYYIAGRHQHGKDNLFSEINEERHKRRRQQMAPGYSGKENPWLEVSIDTHVRELIHLIRTKYLSTETLAKPVDMAKKLQYLTLDVISEISFGEPFGDLRNDADVNGYIESTEAAFGIAAPAVSLGLVQVLHFVTMVWGLVQPEVYQNGFGWMIANARALIKKRLNEGVEKHTDMLASFVRHGLNEEELVTESTLQIVAGSDTTVTSIRGIILYLMSHPRVYAKLQAEVDAAVRDGSAPPSPASISDAAARKLPYLQAVIKEGIRIHPPVTDEVPKKVPAGGDTVVVEGESFFLPGGTNVAYAVWALHRSKDLFGEDAELFRPERWLVEKDEEKLSRMNRAHDIMFGYGKYQCLGRPIAIMEIGKTIFELLRNFNLCLANPEKPWVDENYIGIFMQRHLWVLVTERHDSV
ncbi:cytochrome P450 [Thozetella sp. PMI_491]|nr:cytochrome P450 [Thozetella sp. PMI_491]